jgi:hypothetical protein
MLMPIQLTSGQVWQAIEKELFAVIGFVTARQEARTVGIVYVVRDRKLYIATGKDTWKARHIGGNRHVSVTIPVVRRIPLMPWMKIPAATITFAGTARIIPAQKAPAELLAAIFRGASANAELVADSCLIEVTPVGDFVTYGIGVPLMQMRHPEQARGRAAVDGP